MHQGTALAEVKTEFGRYFDALRRHPRLLVGEEVPSLKGEGTEVLRDSADAKDWQDAVKQRLAEEVRDRAERFAEANNGTLQVLHSSIELFQNNGDLVPGTRQFDPELAARFVQLAKPYELRVDGKLNGYSIPVQPLVEQIRAQLIASRAVANAAPASQAAPGSTTGRPAPAAAPPAARGPQKGVQARAGASADTEDFSVLFGTIGLPTLRI